MPKITGVDLAVEPGMSLLIKVDVEGHELSVLNGLRKLLDDASAIRLFVELNPKCLAQAGSGPEDVLEWLWGNGFRYSPWTIGPGLGGLSRREPTPANS